MNFMVYEWDHKFFLAKERIYDFKDRLRVVRDKVPVN